MSTDIHNLYELLPTVYRTEDAKRGEPLKALLNIIAEQQVVLEGDIDQLYDDQFIETCAEWVVPYIGDLIGVRGLNRLELAEIDPGVRKLLSQRAQVANTLRYRRRKGTAAVLEDLAKDVTGWYVRAVEYFRQLAMSQNLNHLRLSNHTFPDLRAWQPLQYLGTPFNTMAHSVDVRSIKTGRGQMNIPNVGLFIWRIRPYAWSRTPLFSPVSGYGLLNSLGIDASLINKPKTETDVSHLADPVNVPHKLRRRVLYDKQSRLHYYGPGKAFVLYKKNDTTAQLDLIPEAAIEICNLSDSDQPWTDIYERATGDAPYRIDPELGRVVIPTAVDESTIYSTFHYGLPADFGGGEYPRLQTFYNFGDDDQPARILVPDDESTLQDALDHVTSDAIVEITNSDSYLETPLLIHVTQNEKLEVRAGDGCKPIIRFEEDPAQSNIVLSGDTNTTVVLNGLLINGSSLAVPATYKLNGSGEPLPNQLKHLVIRHCTFVPGIKLNEYQQPLLPEAPSIIVAAPDTLVEIDHCIVGGLRIHGAAAVKITNSIIDATADTHIAYAGLDGITSGGRLSIENSTIVGKVKARIIENAMNSIFVAKLVENDDWATPVQAERIQQGCVRFCYLPLSSHVPRRYRCQPSEKEDDNRIKPAFSSLRYGDEAYGQLSWSTPIEITRGAEDESEMGVYHNLYQPQRDENLRMQLDEYLRVGLEAGIFYVS